MKRLLLFALVFAGFSRLAFATVAFDAASVQSTDASSTITRTHTPVGTPTGVAVLIGWVDVNSRTISSVTYGGASLTQLGTTQSDFTYGFWKTAIFGSTSTPSSGAQTVTVTFSGALSNGGSITTVTVTGGASTALVGTGQATASDTGPAGGTITGTTTNELAIDTVITAAGIGFTVGSGQTSIANETTPPNNGSYRASYKTVTGSTESMAWTITGLTSWTWSGASFADSGGCTPHHLTVTSQPTNAAVGASIGTVSIAIKDSGGATCTSDTSDVTLTENGAPAGFPWGTLVSGSSLTKAAVAGIATWTDLSVTGNPGRGAIEASDTGLVDATTDPFNIKSAGTSAGSCGVDVKAASSNTNTSVTTGTDTTGCTALVVYCGTGATGATVSDSKSNTWTALTQYQSTSVDETIKGYYAENPTVGSSHTFTCTTTAAYPAMCMMGLSGTGTSSILRSQAGGGTSGAAMTLSPGSVSPDSTDIVLSAITTAAASGATTIDSSFLLVTSQTYVAATNYAMYCAWKDAPSGTENPAWSWANSTTVAGTNTVFKKAAASGSGANGQLTLGMGVGQ